MGEDTTQPVKAIKALKGGKMTQEQEPKTVSSKGIFLTSWMVPLLVSLAISMTIGYGGYERQKYMQDQLLERMDKVEAWRETHMRRPGHPLIVERVAVIERDVDKMSRRQDLQDAAAKKLESHILRICAKVGARCE